MKRSYKILLGVALLSVVLIQACKPDLKGELGDPYDKVDGLDGTWTLQSVIQTDEKAPDKRTLDLSSYYLGDGGASITFNKNNNTYTANFNSGKNFFGDAGTWEMTNAQFSIYNRIYPDALWLINGTDSIELTLGQPVRSFDSQLYLRLERGCLDGEEIKVRSSYEFEFVRN